ncbi:hypothetical protein LDENG_00188290, partial [Lucifuga dentata]
CTHTHTHTHTHTQICLCKPKTGIKGCEKIICGNVNRMTFEGPYHPFCMFEPNIFNFHTCYVTDNHFPKDKIRLQLS